MWGHLSAVLVRVVADVPAQQEVRQQAQVFRMTYWCPTPQTRDAAVGAIDPAMAPTAQRELGRSFACRMNTLSP